MIPAVDDPATLEAIGCREAFALAQDLHIQNFVISSDSKQVVADIVRGTRSKYGVIISEITSLENMFQYNFIFKGRDVNYEAHNLAKYSLSLSRGCHV